MLEIAELILQGALAIGVLVIMGMLLGIGIVMTIMVKSQPVSTFEADQESADRLWAPLPLDADVAARLV